LDAAKSKRKNKVNIRLSERELRTKFGSFAELLYYDGQSESIALVMGSPAGAENVLCRIHSSCISAHVFNSIECQCREEMAAAQELIGAAGQGIIIYLDQEGKGNGHLALMESIPFKKAGLSQSQAYRRAGFESDARSFRPAAEILNDLNVKSIILLTNNPEKAEELRRASIAVSETRELNL
jgi:GTP cyclohydrolase II